VIFLLILCFTVIPVFEIFLLFQFSDNIGGLNTILLVIMTGVVGATLARQQGYRVMAEVQAKMQDGQLPASDLVQGVLIFCGGLLLLTPGFVTDALGLALVLPGTRHIFAGFLLRYFKQKVQTDSFHVYSDPRSVHFNNREIPPFSETVDVEHKDITDKSKK